MDDNKKAQNELRQLWSSFEQLRSEVSDHGKNNFNQIGSNIQFLTSNFDDSRWQSVKRDIDDLKKELSQHGKNISSSIDNQVRAVDNVLKK